MKQFFILLLIFILSYFSLSAQVDLIENKIISEIFTDFHVNLNDTSKTNGFGINRAYLGYSFIADNNFSAKLIVNIGNPDDMINGALRRRYAFFREASITWSDDKLRMALGLNDTRISRFQQRWWGKRYLANNYQSINGYGFTADLGFTADYKFSELISADITVMNGEGYLELQLDNGVKSSLGISITPNSNFAFRLYGDIEHKSDIQGITGIMFAGYRNKILNIGAEVSSKTNLNAISGHNAWGLSASGGINFTEKNEIFIRYDYSTSVIPDGETQQWNYLNDGTFTIIGVQHSFTHDIRLSLNFQGKNPYEEGRNNSNMIYTNALFRF